MTALPVQNIFAKIEILQNWLKTDPEARNWAVDKLKNTPEADLCEKARWSLTNEVLKPETKILKTLNEIEREHSISMLSEIVKVTLPFDRSNACMIMKLDFKNPDCQNGFMWITEQKLEKIPMDKRPNFGGKVQNYSITNAYLILAEECGEIRPYIEEMTQTRVPLWMKQTGMVSDKFTEF